MALTSLHKNRNLALISLHKNRNLALISLHKNRGALPLRGLWPVACGCGLWLWPVGCGLWLWPVAVACGCGGCKGLSDQLLPHFVPHSLIAEPSRWFYRAALQ